MPRATQARAWMRLGAVNLAAVMGYMANALGLIEPSVGRLVPGGITVLVGLYWSVYGPSDGVTVNRWYRRVLGRRLGATFLMDDVSFQAVIRGVGILLTMAGAVALFTSVAL